MAAIYRILQIQINVIDSNTVSQVIKVFLVLHVMSLLIEIQLKKNSQSFGIPRMAALTYGIHKDI